MLPATPCLTYAIGDIHGRLDLLERAEAAIARHAAGRLCQVVCLGDYVDRGPRSREVVETLMVRRARAGWICLKGNHEDMMVEAASSGDVARWVGDGNGGEATLASYGGLAAVPDAHLAWLANLPLLHHQPGAGGGRLFVHAGVRPGVPLAEQDAHTLMWIRDLFLAAPAEALPCHVVHGHTPCWRGKPAPSLPERLPHRTNLDTGACWTGVLSVGVFAEGEDGGPGEVLAVRA